MLRKKCSIRIHVDEHTLDLIGIRPILKKRVLTDFGRAKPTYNWEFRMISYNRMDSKNYEVSLAWDEYNRCARLYVQDFNRMSVELCMSKKKAKKLGNKLIKKMSF